MFTEDDVLKTHDLLFNYNYEKYVPQDIKIQCDKAVVVMLSKNISSGYLTNEALGCSTDDFLKSIQNNKSYEIISILRYLHKSGFKIKKSKVFTEVVSSLNDLIYEVYKINAKESGKKNE